MAQTFIRPSQIANVPLANNLVALNKADPTEATFSNSAAENTLWSYNLPGGVIGANDALTLRFRGSLLNNSGGILVYTFRLKYGATTLLTIAPSVLNAATAWAYDVDATIKNFAATNSQKAVGKALVMTGVVTSMLGGIGTSAIDSTVAQTIALTIQSAAATATQTVLQQMAEVYYLKNT